MSVLSKILYVHIYVFFGLTPLLSLPPLESSLVPSLQVYFPEGSLQFEIVSNPKESQPEPEVKRGHHSSSSSFQEARKKLLRVAGQRIETQRKHQQLLRYTFSTIS